MKKVFLVLLAVLILISCHCGSQKITPESIWKPSKEALNQIFQCRNNPNTYLSCLIQVMERNGASQEAIRFTKTLDGRGFMVAFQDLGRVDLVQTLELGADYSQGCYLVNGSPQMINVLISRDLPDNFWLKECRIQKNSIENGVFSYVFNYDVKDCHACTVKSVASVAFRLDEQGNSLGCLKNK